MLRKCDEASWQLFESRGRGGGGGGGPASAPTPASVGAAVAMATTTAAPDASSAAAIAAATTTTTIMSGPPKSLDFSLGIETYRGLALPKSPLSIREFKDLIEQGHYGRRVANASRLVCRLEQGGKPCGNEELLPEPPQRLILEGSPFLLGAVAALLRQSVALGRPQQGFGDSEIDSSPVAAGGLSPSSTVNMSPRSIADRAGYQSVTSRPRLSFGAPPSPTSWGGSGLTAGLPQVLQQPSSAKASSSARKSLAATARPKPRPTVVRCVAGPSGGGSGNNRGGEEHSGVLDGEAAEKVLNFWFEELNTEDWFSQSHLLDDRIRSEFGALHQRAAAGELAGWMQRPDTCLALVVILDQFSRRIYGQGSPEASAWDPMARLAANKALERRDDRVHWPSGPRRTALYLPFMHSEDMADKRRCVALMREGLKPDGSSGTEEQLASSGGEAAAATAASSSRASGKIQAPLARGGSTQLGLPRLVGAQQSRNRFRQDVSGAGGTDESDSDSDAGGAGGDSALSAYRMGTVVAGTAGNGDGHAAHSAAAQGNNNINNNSGSNNNGNSGGGASGSAAAAAGTGGGGSGRNAKAQDKAKSLMAVIGVLEDSGGSYNMRAALDLPQLPVLTLNHEHTKLFRAMRLDSQTQQAYMRDRKDINRSAR
mmetsp:Transcript_9626/g.20934  ORF Transcript_9626/g.20934 Transcript_9626/m.20934 type:complete len:655 (-) Transcript_9626:204-2168(-)